MAAAPTLVLVDRSEPKSVLVIGRRDRDLSAPRAKAGGANCVVIRSQGRRAGASEALVKELLAAGATTVVVPSLLSLHSTPSRALGIVAALRAAGVVTHSLAEPGISSADGPTLTSIAGFLVAAEKQRASRQGAEVIARLSRTGRPIGRPRKSLPCSVEEARAVVEERGYRLAGQLLGLSASTVRRVLKVAAETTKGGAP
jgi:hypothetical protein